MSYEKFYLYGVTNIWLKSVNTNLFSKQKRFWIPNLYWNYRLC